MLRRLVATFLLLLVFEGALRKWILPEFQALIFSLKDLVLGAAFVAFILQQWRWTVRQEDLLPWFAWLGLIFVHLIGTGFSYEALVGLRYYLAPLPLILLVPSLLRRPEDLDRVAAWAVRIAIPICILAIVQYYSPLDSPINRYVWGDEDSVSSFGVESDIEFARPRVTATFSYISTFAAFLNAVWIFGWLSMLHARDGATRAIAGLGLVLIAFGMAMNGSRSLLLLAALTALPFAWATLRRLRSFTVQLSVLGALLAALFAGATVFEPFMLTVERGDAGEMAERVRGILLLPFTTVSTITWFGAGIGSTFGGFEQLGLQGSEGFDEVNLDRVGIELGVIGYVFSLALKALVVGKAIAVYFRAPTAELRHWCLSALMLYLGSNWQVPIYNAISATFFFAAVGLVYWIDAESRRLRQSTLRAAPARWSDA